jgi:hypothetical protein
MSAFPKKFWRIFFATWPPKTILVRFMQRIFLWGKNMRQKILQILRKFLWNCQI